MTAREIACIFVFMPLSGAVMSRLFIVHERSRGAFVYCWEKRCARQCRHSLCLQTLPGIIAAIFSVDFNQLRAINSHTTNKYVGVLCNYAICNIFCARQCKHSLCLQTILELLQYFRCILISCARLILVLLINMRNM